MALESVIPHRHKSPLYHYMMIIRFVSMGYIILSGDFNAQNKDEQTTTFDSSEAVYEEVMAEGVGLK